MADPAATAGPRPSESARPASATAEAGARPEPLLQTLQGLLRELPGLVGDRVELFSLEVERAGRALAQIAILVIGAALLGVTAWLAAWALVVGLLLALGLPWAAALAIVLVFNVAAVLWMVGRARALVPTLGLPATRRHLTFTPDPSPRAAPAEPPVHARPPGPNGSIGPNGPNGPNSPIAAGST